MKRFELYSTNLTEALIQWVNQQAMTLLDLNEQGYYLERGEWNAVVTAANTIELPENFLKSVNALTKQEALVLLEGLASQIDAAAAELIAEEANELIGDGMELTLDDLIDYSNSLFLEFLITVNLMEQIRNIHKIRLN